MFNTVVKNISKVVVVLSLVVLAQNNAALADSEDNLEIRVCAAVYPCDDQGNVLPEYLRANDSCSEVYIQQCAIQQAKRNQSAKLSCVNKTAKLERKISYLRGQLRAMKSRVDRLKRAQVR